MLNIIDLFCGAGGMSKGFDLAGYNVVLGIDANKYAIETHHYNFPNCNSINADLTVVTPEEILNTYHINKDEIVGIVGGPPCQGFSLAGKRLEDDPRNKLFLEFVKFVQYVKPKFFLMENVPGLLSMSEGKVKDEIFKIFTDIGYQIEATILDSSNFNVPQIRKRLFFLGFLDKKPNFPKPTTLKPKTVWEAINDLPPLQLGEGSDEFMYNDKIYFNHYAFPIQDINKRRIESIPEGGGYKDIPDDIKRKVDYISSYKRLNRNKPSCTITVHFRDSFLIHPTQNRIITVREAARLQSFPDNFKFIGPKSRIGQLGLVGNAVPTLLAKALAEEIKKQL